MRMAGRRLETMRSGLEGAMRIPGVEESPRRDGSPYRAPAGATDGEDEDEMRKEKGRQCFGSGKEEREGCIRGGDCVGESGKEERDDRWLDR